MIILGKKLQLILCAERIEHMLYYDQNKYKKCISEETIINIENKMGIQCLFGGAFSTCVYGIDNKSSDFDFYLIYDKKETDIESFRYFDEEIFNDIVMLDWNYVNANSDSYLRGIKKYPSVLYRSNEKEHSLNFHRADFTSNIIFEILYSDYIWDSGFLVNNMHNVLRNISYLGTLDYYFTRAWGNFNHELLTERGRAVKYLMTFLGYACMRWLIEYKTIPSMDITFMLNQYMPGRFAEFFNEVLDKQKNLETDRDFRTHSFNVGTHNLFRVDAKTMDSSTPLMEKEAAYIERNEDLNFWMRQELNFLAQRIEQIADERENIHIEQGNTALLFKSCGTLGIMKRGEQMKASLDNVKIPRGGGV